MCGIAGIYDRSGTFAGDALQETVSRMGEQLRHRGPDGDGIWHEPNAHIALAHRRLAVIAPTPEGYQPALSRCGRYALSYNGEIYNFGDILEDLAADGHPVETASDTVALAEAIASWGVRKTVARLVGMFAFAVFDRKTRTLTLVRDRLGIKPLYWAANSQLLAFSSELGGLAASGALSLSRDPAAFAAYLRLGCIPAPATIYREARKLEPGCLLELGPSGEVAIERYWDIADIARRGMADPFPQGDADSQAETERLLSQAVSDRLISDMPLGGWLSGGIDSSCVVALMQTASTRPVRTFSIGFPAFGYDESKDAATIARHLGTDHTEMTVTPKDAIAAITHMPAVYDEPFADSSQLPTYILSRLTRTHVTVALSGDGGDEVFAGYNRYAVLPRIAARTAGWPRAARKGVACGLRSLSPHAWDRLARALPVRMPPQFGDKVWKAADACEADGLEQAYLAAISQWPLPDAVSLGGNGGWEECSLDPGLGDPVAQLQLADSQTYLPDDILTKVDRASMAHALEVRVPLLDHRLVEHAWRLPRADLIGPDGTKKPLRNILARHVPAGPFDHPKSGFAVPVGEWLRGPLREWADDLLSEDALMRSGMLSPRTVRDAWARHLSGRQNLQNRLWVVLMFQLWDRAAPC